MTDTATTNAAAIEAAAFSRLTASAQNFNPDCARILFGPRHQVNDVLDNYADSEYQETDDLPDRYTIALIVFATPEQAAKAARAARIAGNVRVYDASGNPSDDDV